MRPIDADALLKCRRNFGKDYALDPVDKNIDDQLVDLRDVLNAPTLDYAPVRHGEWIENELEYPEEVIFRYKCSECGRTELLKEPYCHCGAKMDGGKSGD